MTSRPRLRIGPHPGQATARKAHHGFGMRVRYFARRRADAGLEAESGATFCDSLDRLVAEADFLSLHCPGGAQNRHLIDARRLALMKKTAFVINTARGEVVDELALENVVLLPHLGSATLETRIAMGMRVARNLDSFFAGHAPPDRVA